MQTPRVRPWGWLVVVVVLAVGLLTVATFRLLTRGDQIVAEAAANLEEGMSEDQLREVLQPIRPPVARDKTFQGLVRYQFYATDGFVTITLDKDGPDARVANIQYLPDVGPIWDRLRRRWEHRYR